MPSTTVINSLKHEIKETFSLGLPLVASNLIYASSGFIGTAMIARLGEDALAASVLVSTIWMSLSVLFFGLLNSISVLVSHQYGAKNIKTISDIMGQSFYMGILVIIFITLLLLSTPIFLHLSSQPQEVIKLSIDYMHALMLTVPGLILLVIYEQFLTGINRARFVLRISLLVVPIEIPIIYILIFGKFGLPKCGVAGIGYGLAITYTTTAILLTLYLMKSKVYRHFEIFKRMNRIHWYYLKELITVGLPIGFMHVIEVSTFAVMTFWVARFGTTLLAAHQIAFQYLGFLTTFVFALSQAITVRVGHSVGRLDVTGIHYAIYVGIALSIVSMIIMGLCLHFFPTFFLALDVNVHAPANQLLIQDASGLLSICAVLMLFDSFRISGFGALRGLKDTRFPMYISFITFWVIGLSFSFFAGFVFNLDGRGIWWGITFGILFGAILILMRLQRILKKLDIKTLKRIHGYGKEL